MKNNIKDWQIAQSMFGKNTKNECRIVANLRKNNRIETLCEGWSIIYDTRLEDDCGWIISNEFINN